MSRNDLFHIDGVLFDRVLQRVHSPKGRELVSSLVHIGDGIESAIDVLDYEYKYRCVVDDEMGPANSSAALEQAASLEQSLLEAKQALEEMTTHSTRSGEVLLRFC